MELGSGIDERRSHLLFCQALADQSSTRRGLALQKQQLLISIDQLTFLVAPIGELPSPDFGVEESAVSAVKNTMATMEGFLILEQEYEIAELREVLTPER